MLKIIFLEVGDGETIDRRVVSFVDFIADPQCFALCGPVNRRAADSSV
jgi:hypothetical protein